MTEQVEFISMDFHPSYDMRVSLRLENGSPMLYECNNCKYHAPREQLRNFCPECGGKISRIVNKEYERSLRVDAEFGYCYTRLRW